MGTSQPLREALDWTPARRPERTELRGSHVLLRPVDPDADAEPLYAASTDPGHWTYLPDGPYESPQALERMLRWAAGSDDPFYFTLATLPDARPGATRSTTRRGAPPSASASPSKASSASTWS